MGAPMNPALAVTAVRIAAIPVVMVLLLSGIPNGGWWAAGLYLAAAATDSLDGWLARSRGVGICSPPWERTARTRFV